MISIIRKFNKILSNQQRATLGFLVILMLFGMFLEIFGLGILVPMLKLLLDPELFNQQNFISDFWHFLGNINKRSFKIICLSVILIYFLIKSFFLVFVNYRQNKFLSFFIASITNELFHNYLKQPYSFHLNRNYTSLIKNIQVESNHLFNISQWILAGIIEFGFLLSILATLVYIEPVGALSMGLFLSVFSFLFFKFSKKKLVVWGKLRLVIEEQLSKSVVEGFSSVKDIKVFGKEIVFSEEFKGQNLEKARLFSNETTSSQLPRYFLEFVSVFGLIGFLIVMLLQDKDGTGLMVTLGVFVVAIFRILPSMNKIIVAFQKIHFFGNSIDLFYKEILDTRKSNESGKLESFVFKDYIEINDLYFTYGDDQKTILNNISLKIKKGESIGFIGESGSGKSTFVDLLIGLLKPTSGDIVVDGVSINENLKGWQNSVGYVSQSINLFDRSISENVALGVKKDKIDFDRIIDVLEKVQLLDYIKGLEEGIHTMIGDRGVKLSGGQRQRLGIARALYNNPQVLILDEATAALDTKTEKLFMDSVNKLKGEVTLIMIAHRTSTLSDCDKIFEVKEGEILINNILDAK